MREVIELITPVYKDELTELDLEISSGELVRCENCKYYPNGDGATFWVPCREMITASRWYCAYGEKNE